MLQTLH